MGTSSQDHLSRLLAEVAKPGLYRANAFRILQVPVDIPARKLAQHVHRMEMAARLGIGRDAQPAIMPLEPPPGDDAVRQAVQRLRDPETRFVEEFFWFWPARWGSSASDAGLKAFASGGEEAASKVWGADKDVASIPLVALHNLAVLAHAEALDVEHEVLANDEQSMAQELLEPRWLSALQRWKRLCDSDEFWAKVARRIARDQDPRLTSRSVRQFRERLPVALLLVNVRLAVRYTADERLSHARRHLSYIEASGFDREAIEEAARRALEPEAHRVEAMASAAEADADEHPDHGLKRAQRLTNDSAGLLSVFDALLPESDSLRRSVHDKIAAAAQSCIIDYGNATEQWADAAAALSRIEGLALGEGLRERIRGNRKTAEENAEAEKAYEAAQRAYQTVPVGRASSSGGGVGSGSGCRPPGCLIVFLVLIVIGAIIGAIESCQDGGSYDSSSGEDYSFTQESGESAGSDPAESFSEPQSEYEPLLGSGLTRAQKEAALDRLFALTEKLTVANNNYLAGSAVDPGQVRSWAKELRRWRREYAQHDCPKVLLDYALAGARHAEALAGSIEGTVSVEQFNARVRRVNAAREKVRTWAEFLPFW